MSYHLATGEFLQQIFSYLRYLVRRMKDMAKKQVTFLNWASQWLL